MSKARSILEKLNNKTKINENKYKSFKDWLNLVASNKNLTIFGGYSIFATSSIPEDLVKVAKGVLEDVEVGTRGFKGKLKTDPTSLKKLIDIVNKLEQLEIDFVAEFDNGKTSKASVIKKLSFND